MSVLLGPPTPAHKSAIARPQTFELPPVSKHKKKHPAGDSWETHVSLDDLRARCKSSSDQDTAIPGYEKALVFPPDSDVVPLQDRPPI